MAISEVHLTQQNVLQKMTSFMVILPEGKQGPFPVLYLLHGLSDDHTAWTRRSNIDLYVQDLPLIVVMPNGERSWYSNMEAIPTEAHETFITQDLIHFVDNTFNTIVGREGRVIAGLSMGGYGAFKLALKYPDLFLAAASFSGAVDVSRRMDSELSWKGEFPTLLGRYLAQDNNDIIKLLQQSDRGDMPSLWMCCGDQDDLIEDNRRVHNLMNSLGIQHFYREDQGFAHSWNYWDIAIKDALKFFSKELKIA